MGRSAGKVRSISEGVRAAKESTSDPKEVIWKAIGGQFKDEVLHNGVLVATYIQPSMTKGGIYVPDSTLQEDIYQGTVGMVIALGPAAFKDDKIAQFHGVKLNIGDWVLYRPSDGIAMEYKEVPCRLFTDVNIMMRVQKPEFYW